MKPNFLIPLFVLPLILAACESGPENVSDDITPLELVQRAQEATDRNRYGTALQYYEIILDKFPYDLEMIFTAKYEIAFIHYKQRQYDLAQSEFIDLLAQYDTPDEELLPAQFKRLSTIVLEQIDEKTKGRKKSG
jgi:outer membrane protein assembly factor BamD (BamD/ComL family)